MPLVDLSKKEMKTIIEALQFQMVESESLDDFICIVFLKQE